MTRVEKDGREVRAGRRGPVTKWCTVSQLKHFGPCLVRWEPQEGTRQGMAGPDVGFSKKALGAENSLQEGKG